MKIEIDNAEVISTEYKDKNTGEPKVMRKQSAYWHKKDCKYPIEFIFTLGDEQPIDVGVYNVDPETFMSLSRFSSLEVDNYSVADEIRKAKKVA